LDGRFFVVVLRIAIWKAIWNAINHVSLLERKQSNQMKEVQNITGEKLLLRLLFNTESLIQECKLVYEKIKCS